MIMDEKHKELLQVHRVSFAQCVDTDRLVPFLLANGVLNVDDVNELGKQGNQGRKAERLLDILPTKGTQVFQTLCLALETTYPHLLTVMFLGGSPQVGGMSEDLLRSNPSPSSQSVCSHQDIDLQQNNLAQLRMVSTDRDVWRRDLTKIDRDGTFRRLTTGGDSVASSLSTLSKGHASSTSDHSLNSGRECESLHPSSDIHLLRYQTGDFTLKADSSLRDSEFYHSKQKISPSKMDDQRHETIILKKQYNELLADKHRLEQEIDRLQRFREEDRKEVAELRRQQQETHSEVVSSGGGGDEAHQLYLNAARKCEGLKDDYDTLHKRYADLMATHSATVSKLEVTQEEISCWRKRYEDLAHERNAAIRERNGLQQQCTAAIRQWDNALRERNEAREQLAKVQQQRDEAMKEINQAMAVRIKATKDLARLTEERNAAVQEYSLIMSERDTVHKEMERLQEELTEAQKLVKATDGLKKAALEEIESLKREICSALQDRDHALKECNDLREKYGDYVTGKEDGPRDKEWLSRKYDEPHWESGREGNRSEREGHQSWESPGRDNIMKTHGQWLDDLDQANREVESLRRQVERLQTELVEAMQEAEVCKRRRDWAFSERDKIVLERESIRTLCDKLRRERDRAVSDLAEALRDSDDIKRQKNETSKELKELREKIEAQLEKESRMKQLNSVGNNHSRDSAIDADMQEWETETLDVNLRGTCEEELGFEIGGGKRDSQNPNDSSIYVSSIVKGGKCDGKLKANDCIIRINGIDTTSVEKQTALEAIKSGGGVVSLVVRRRRLTSSRGVQNVLLNVNSGKHHGLTLENGVYISKITPGSVAAREGSVAVGDRILSINGKSMDSIQASGVHDLLEVSGSTLMLQVSKCAPCPNSPPSSFSSAQNVDRSDRKKTSSPHSNNDNSVPSSPTKEVNLSVVEESQDISDREKVMTSISVQTEDVQKYSSPVEHSVIVSPTRRQKVSSDNRSRIPSSQPTLLDRAYRKIFGECRQTTKEKKSSHLPHSPSLQHDEEDPIAELDSMLDHYSNMPLTKSSKENHRKEREREREREREKNGGTWPKYRGPLLHYTEVGTVTTLQPYKKKERKSLTTFTKQINFYDSKGHSCVTKQPSESRVNCILDRCGEKERDRVAMYVECQRGSQSSDCSTVTNIPVISPSASTTQTSSSGSSYTSPEVGSPIKSNLSSQSTEQLGEVAPPPSYSGSTSPTTCLDYSVVSAHRNKDVIEFYKNRNKQRPRSAHYVLSDSECLSSLESTMSGQYSKSLASSALDRTPYSHSETIQLPFTSPDRPLTTRSSGHMHPTPVPTSLTPTVISPQNLLQNSMPFYTITSGQRGIAHSHPHHTHNTVAMCGNHSTGIAIPPLPSSSRYSSPPGLSVYTSRSGDSLLSASTAESMLGNETRSYHSRVDSGRYTIKDSGRYSFTPPSPCPSQYSFSGPSPTQSIELPHFHPISAASQSSKRVVPTHSHVHGGYRGDDSFGPPSYDGLSTFPKRNQRIRIPSNPSVTSKSSAGKVSSSSIEKASSCISERNSPLPPFTVEWQNPDGSQHVPLDFRGRKPKPGDLRSICIEKSSEPLGIQISCGAGGGIFVSSVSENSLAAQAGLQIGDHLLEVCGINMRSATYTLAANVLRQCGSSITMLVQYNPEKFHEVVPDTGSSSDDVSPPQTPIAPHKSCRMKTVDISTEDVPSSAASTLTKQKAALSLAPMEKNSLSSKTSGQGPRVVVLKKTTSNLGISLLGGNAVGIFVHSIQEDSPAHGPNGLRPGDQILEYNGVDLRNATAEEAAYELAKPADTVTILAQHNLDRYTEIQDQPGDSFYVRVMFDRPCIDGSLSFHKDDILLVDNTMYNGVPGLWLAWLVDEEGQKVKCGFIPSKYKVEEELHMKKSLGELEGVDGSRRGSTSARRSFFRRKRHHRSNSRDSKELASFSDVSINSCSDSGTLGEELIPPTYLKVEKQNYLTMRPVIIVGPLMEAVVDQLEQDFPHMFQRTIPEVMRGSQQMMERGLRELKLVDYRRRGNHFECTTIAAVKEIYDKNCHALLDVGLSAGERLQQCQIYPIVIFLKFKSTKQIREVKVSKYLTEKVSTKAAKEMYEHALKIESEFKHIINAVIPGSNLAYMCTQVKTCVEEEQSKTLWVPSGTL